MIILKKEIFQCVFMTRNVKHPLTPIKKMKKCSKEFQTTVTEEYLEFHIIYKKKNGRKV